MPKKRFSAVDASRIDWVFDVTLPQGSNPETSHVFPGEMKVIMGAVQRIAATSEAVAQSLYLINKFNPEKARADILEKKLKLLESLAGQKAMSRYHKLCKVHGYE